MSLRPSGNLNPGKLDRRVVIQQYSTARDAAGGAIPSWTTLATVWAEKDPQGGGRLFAAEAKQFETTLIYGIRHRTDVRAGMRLVHGDDTFEIVLPRELGRGTRLFLLCRGINQTTASQAA